MDSNSTPEAYQGPTRSAKLKPPRRPKLEDIKLAHVLNGHTCPPISFTDFASYLAKREMTLENLLFVLWFRSYSHRWAQASDTHRVPVPLTELHHRHDPFTHLTVSPDSWLDPIDQPMRDEAQRAFATFFQHGATRELNCTDDLRGFVGTCLRRSTAPEVFRPVYDEVYGTLEMQSLPRFIDLIRSNTNWKKQGYWCMVGAFDLLCGIILFVLLTLFLKPTHFSQRAIRLPSAIFVWFGSGSLYSAYRGFCSHVWGRSSMQIKPWELDEWARREDGTAEG
ncbi:hypothetical protein BD324DRAFT_638996 [Kockovaella imperatae]|uniref:RGS domain-containing protein n=1 Tax=Kockovaella imperatae TaxID=4999 RepID=A0A1Y1U6L8_9TREE|nr:hypothetical protein BD324DRAFT_638996 [Kockovaella imperatae]ORX33642.1 hypothetical protein BD324DRAFT_638996 [Kockovaella imperatae]